VLDDALNPVAENVLGEMYLAGDCLARGYHKRPTLTAEKFINNPFTPGQRMYRTGDLARWLPQGMIEYAGRKGNALKAAQFADGSRDARIMFACVELHNLVAGAAAGVLHVHGHGNILVG